MKMKVLTVSLLAAAVTGFTGCSDKAPTPQSEKEAQIEANNNLPAWVLNPTSENGITAVGIAGYSKHGMQVMLPQAEMDGRAKLAGKIQTEVSRLERQALRTNQIEDQDNFEQVFTQTTEAVVKKIPLSGAKRVNNYQAPDGTLYVQMVIDRSEIADSLADMKALYQSQMEQANMTRKSLDEGMKVLDDMIDDLHKATE